MRAVIQRVRQAEVQVDGVRQGAIGPGLLVLACIEDGDSADDLAWMARKLVRLRIFADEQAAMNRSVGEVDGEILAVSQFTLAGSIARGRRPSFDGAMNPEAARVLFRRFLELLRAQYPRVKSGFFQEHMEVELVNDGPVTFILER